jgi:ribosomal protein S18 acetylase RimI-like enzyme
VAEAREPQVVVRPYRPSTDFRMVLDSQGDLYELNFPRFRATPEFRAEQAVRIRQATRRPYENRLFVADSGEGVVGFIWVALRMDLQGLFGSVDQVYVSAAYRGQGIGAKLMDAAHQFLEEASVPFARLYVTASNERATSLYQRLGYRTVRWEMERPV